MAMGEKLATARKQAGLTQERLADRIGDLRPLEVELVVEDHCIHVLFLSFSNEYWEN